jgi:hypothetical protein
MRAQEVRDGEKAVYEEFKLEAVRLIKQRGVDLERLRTSVSSSRRHSTWI